MPQRAYCCSPGDTARYYTMLGLGRSLATNFRLGGSTRSNFATSGEISAKLDCQFRAFTALWLMKVGVSSIGLIGCIHFCRWTSPHVRSSDSESACARIALSHISLPITSAKDIVRNCARAGSRRSGRKNGGPKMAAGGARRTRSQVLESGNKPASTIRLWSRTARTHCGATRPGKGGSPGFRPGQKDPRGADQNFVRLLFFFACCFLVKLLVPNETPAAKFALRTNRACGFKLPVTRQTRHNSRVARHPPTILNYFPEGLQGPSVTRAGGVPCPQRMKATVAASVKRRK